MKVQESVERTNIYTLIQGLSLITPKTSQGDGAATNTAATSLPDEENYESVIFFGRHLF